MSATPTITVGRIAPCWYRLWPLLGTLLCITSCAGSSQPVAHASSSSSATPAPVTSEPTGTTVYCPMSVATAGIDFHQQIAQHLNGQWGETGLAGYEDGSALRLWNRC